MGGAAFLFWYQGRSRLHTSAPAFVGRSTELFQFVFDEHALNLFKVLYVF